MDEIYRMSADPKLMDLIAVNTKTLPSMNAGRGSINEYLRALGRTETLGSGEMEAIWEEFGSTVSGLCRVGIHILILGLGKGDPKGDTRPDRQYGAKIGKDDRE